jgi:hypothetical protein
MLKYNVLYFFRSSCFALFEMEFKGWKRTVGIACSVSAIFSTIATRHHHWVQHELLSLVFGSLKMGIMLSNYSRRCGVFFHPITDVKTTQCTNSIDFFMPVCVFLSSWILHTTFLHLVTKIYPVICWACYTILINRFHIHIRLINSAGWLSFFSYVFVCG